MSFLKNVLSKKIVIHLPTATQSKVNYLKLRAKLMSNLVLSAGEREPQARGHTGM